MCSNTLTKVAAVIFLAVISAGSSASPGTWHLKGDGEWKKVAEDAGGKYMLAVAKVKQLISAGEVELAQEALEQLKKDFPDIAGAQLDAFMEAELLYAEGKWARAVRKYDEFIDAWPGSWLYESALEREYSVAVAFLSGEKRRVIKILKLSAYEEGAKIMRKVADRVGDAPIARRALVALAKSYQERGKFLDAYEAWADVFSRWPTGQTGREALLEMAHSLHSAYKSHKYDSVSLDSAQSYYRMFKSQHSQLAQEYDIDAKITMIDEQLAYKQLSIGEYYDRTDNKQAANLYYQLVIDSWPDSAAAKMAKARMEAADTEQEPSKKEERSFRRRLFDAGSTFLDSWFGILKPQKGIAR
jgi:outer membrane protein assembly factor BamD (BamD/ComL family)